MGEIKNIPASISERLKNIAKASGRAFDTLLLLYMQERFLYRLSISDFRDNFILKGGLFLFSQNQLIARPTKDVDFLARQITNELETLRRSFATICSIDVPSDGVVFQPDHMTTEKIKEDADYEGVRIKVTALLGRMRKTLQFDIGFGDIVIPNPQSIDYPVLLNMEAPRVQAYSKESVISEKFEAMITLSVMNSRMKDFYDIYMLVSTNDFNGRLLYKAIHETFQRRGTVLEERHPLFKKGFSDNNDRKWMVFMSRLGMEKPIPFGEVMTRLVDFLEPLYRSLLTDEPFDREWNGEEKIWLERY